MLLYFTSDKRISIPDWHFSYVVTSFSSCALASSSLPAIRCLFTSRLKNTKRENPRKVSKKLKVLNRAKRHFTSGHRHLLSKAQVRPRRWNIDRISGLEFPNTSLILYTPYKVGHVVDDPVLTDEVALVCGDTLALCVCVLPSVQRGVLCGTFWFGGTVTCLSSHVPPVPPAWKLLFHIFIFKINKRWNCIKLQF